MYRPSPDPPPRPCFQNLVKTRGRMSSGIPVPSSSTTSSAPPSACAAHRTPTSPSPCRTAFSTRLATIWANLSRSTQTGRSSSGDAETAQPAAAAAARAGGPRPRPRSTGSLRTRAGRRRSARRRAARRSAGSAGRRRRRPSRSISSFCESVNRSHLASRVAVKPLTPVSGQRSSCATVATRSERSTVEPGPLTGVAQRQRRPDDRTARPLAVEPAGDQQLRARTR